MPLTERLAWSCVRWRTSADRGFVNWDAGPPAPVSEHSFKVEAMAAPVSGIPLELKLWLSSIPFSLKLWLLLWVAILENWSYGWVAFLLTWSYGCSCEWQSFKIEAMAVRSSWYKMRTPERLSTTCNHSSHLLAFGLLKQRCANCQWH